MLTNLVSDTMSMLSRSSSSSTPRAATAGILETYTPLPIILEFICSPSSSIATRNTFLLQFPYFLTSKQLLQYLLGQLAIVPSFAPPPPVAEEDSKASDKHADKPGEVKASALAQVEQERAAAR